MKKFLRSDGQATRLRCRNGYVILETRRITSYHSEKQSSTVSSYLQRPGKTNVEQWVRAGGESYCRYKPSFYWHHVKSFPKV